MRMGVIFSYTCFFIYSIQEKSYLEEFLILTILKLILLVYYIYLGCTINTAHNLFNSKLHQLTQFLQHETNLNVCNSANSILTEHHIYKTHKKKIPPHTEYYNAEKLA